MTAAKIAITLPQEQLARVKRAVKDGQAESVSAFIARALVEQEHALEEQARKDNLEALVGDLIAQHGAPSAEDTAWAKRVLRRSQHRK